MGTPSQIASLFQVTFQLGPASEGLVSRLQRMRCQEQGVSSGMRSIFWMKKSLHQLFELEDGQIWLVLVKPRSFHASTGFWSLHKSLPDEAGTQIFGH